MRNATSVGHLLRRLSLAPDLIITSDAVRAQTTAQIVAEAAEYRGKVVQSSLLYHARPDAVIDVLRTIPAAVHRSVMIVGHNPGLEDLLALLTGEQIDLPTAALVCLAVEVDQWSDLDSSRAVSVIGVWTPAEL